MILLRLLELAGLESVGVACVCWVWWSLLGLNVVVGFVGMLGVSGCVRTVEFCCSLLGFVVGVCWACWSLLKLLGYVKLAGVVGVCWIAGVCQAVVGSVGMPLAC